MYGWSQISVHFARRIFVSEINEKVLTFSEKTRFFWKNLKISEIFIIYQYIVWVISNFSEIEKS